MLTGGLTLRRVGVLVRGLPPDSLFASTMAETHPATGEGRQRGWTTDQHLLANIIDATNYTAWAVIASGSQKRVTAPKPMRRPFEHVDTPRLSQEQLDHINMRNLGRR